MASKRLTERLTVSGAMTSESSVDAANYVLRNVVLCGFESANGRRYPRAVLEKECPKYDGAKVYLNHSKNGRLFHEWVGIVQRPKPGPDGRPRGDVQLFKSEPASATVIEKAQVCPGKFGMSHVVMASTRREGGIEVVEGYESVESVDIVTDPATTPAGLFEGKNVNKITLKQFAERFGPKFGPVKWGALSKLCEDYPAMADAPVVDAPADDAAGDAGDLKSALMSALWPIVEQAFDDGNSSKAESALRDFIKLHAKHTGTSADTGGADGDAMTPEGKLPTLRDVIAECKAASLDNPDVDFLERLTGIAEKGTREFFIGQAKKATESKAETPRSTPRDRTVKEDKDKDANTGASLDDIKKRIKG